MEQQQADAFAAEWIAAWNSHDLDRILRHYADNVEFFSPFIRQVTGDARGSVLGKDALRAYWSKALETYPELEFELYHALPGVDSVVLYYRSVKNLLAAEAMEFDARGRVCRVRAHYKLPTS